MVGPVAYLNLCLTTHLTKGFCWSLKITADTSILICLLFNAIGMEI